MKIFVSSKSADFHSFFVNFTWCIGVENPSYWARPQGCLTQQHSNQNKMMNENIDSMCTGFPVTSKHDWGSQREMTSESRGACRCMSPLLPKVILTGCGVCSSLVPCHIFPRGLRSKTIDSSLITWLVFNVWTCFFPSMGVSKLRKRGLQ